MTRSLLSRPALLVALGLLCLPLSASGAGFSEYAEWFGATEPAIGRYVTEMVEASLTQEIRREVDARMTSQEYFAALDLIAAGRADEVRGRLRPEAWRGLLKYTMGNDQVGEMPPDLGPDENDWRKIAAWAEAPDVAACRQFLEAKAAAWRRGQDLTDLDSEGQAERVFSGWFGQARGGFGRGQAPRDRARYADRLEAAAKRLFVRQAAGMRHVLEDQRELRLAVRQKWYEVQDRIVAECGRYREAERVLRKAGERGDMGELALKFATDQGFRRVTEQKAKGRGDSPLLAGGTILRGADAAIADLDEKHKELKKSKAPMIVPLTLEPLTAFKNDYATIMEAIFGNQVFWDEGLLALKEWDRREKDYTKRLEQIAEQYAKDVKKAGPELSGQLAAEANGIVTGLAAYRQELGAIRDAKEAAAAEAYGALRDAATRAQALTKTRFHAGRWDEAFGEVNVRARARLGELARQRLGGTGEAQQLLNHALSGRYESKPVQDYVRKSGKTASEALDNLEGWIADSVVAYEQETGKLFDELLAMSDDDDNLIRSRVEAIRGMEQVFGPRENMVRYAASEYMTKRDRGPEFRADPATYWTEHVESLVGLNKRRKNALATLRAERADLKNLLSWIADAQEDIANNRRFLRYARELRDGAKAVSQRAKGLAPAAALPPDVAALVGREDSVRTVKEMVRRSREGRGLLAGGRSGYERALAADSRGRLGLSDAGFAPWRRSLAQHRDLLAALDRSAAPASPALAGAQDEARQILAELDSFSKEAPIVSDDVLAMRREAETDLAPLFGAGASPGAQEVLREYRALVEQAEAQATEDDRIVQGYFTEAGNLLSARAATPDERLRSLEGAKSALDLAARHLEAMQAYSLYAPDVSAPTQRLDGLTAELTRAFGQVEPPDPVRFDPRGYFHLSVNGVSTQTFPAGAVTPLVSPQGDVEIRSESYDALFQGARKVLVRLDAEGAPPVYQVAARGSADFTWRGRLPAAGVYVLEVLVVDRNGYGYAPTPFPVRLRWAGTGGAAEETLPGGVKVLRVYRSGETVAVRTLLGPPVELKITRGRASDPAEIQVVYAGDRPVYSLRAGEYGAFLGGRWMTLLEYQRSPQQSRLFVPLPSGPDATTRREHEWRFAVSIGPAEQFFVYREDRGAWIPLAVICGADVASPAVPAAAGGGTGRYEDVIVAWGGSDEDFLYSLCRAALHREPSVAEITALRADLRTPGRTRAAVVMSLLNGDAYRARNAPEADYVRDVFQTLLCREPTPQELRDEPVRLRGFASRGAYLTSVVDGAEYRRLLAGGTPGSTPGGVAPPVAAGPPRLVVGSDRVASGGQVTIPVRLMGLSRLGDLTAALTWDATALELTDWAKGAVPAGTLCDVNPGAAGTLMVGIADPRGLDGEVALASLTFKARGRPGRPYEVRAEVRRAGRADTMEAVTLVVENGAVTIVTPGEIPGGATGLVPGDWNRDGKVTSVDALAALRMSIGRLPQDPTLDLDGDGQVTTRDARMLLAKAVESPGGAPPPALVYRFDQPRTLRSDPVPYLDTAMAPAWTADGRGVVAVVPGTGMLLLDAATGATKPLITADPDPISGQAFGAHAKSVTDPMVAGDRVVYQSTLPFLRNGRSRLLYMAVPLAGGKPVLLAELDPEYAVVGAGKDGFTVFHSAPGAAPRLLRCAGPGLAPDRPASTTNLPIPAPVYAVTADLKWAAFALSGFGGPPPWSVKICELPSGKIIDLTPDKALGALCFSPDGKHVAAVRGTARGREVVVFALADPAKVFVVATGLSDCSGPAWSPDGTRLAFSGVREVGAGTARPRSDRVLEVVEVGTLR